MNEIFAFFLFIQLIFNVEETWYWASQLIYNKQFDWNYLVLGR